MIPTPSRRMSDEASGSSRVETIFAATDLSEAADEALRQAHAWAELWDARLAVCHVIPDPLRSLPLFPHRHREIIEQLRALQDRAAARVAQRVEMLTGRSGGEYKLVIEQGSPEALIIERAEQAAAGLIVVGARGASGSSHAGLGRVSGSVIRYAHGPVLVARRSTPTGHLLVGTDFSETSALAVEAAARVSRRRGGRLTLLHSIDTGSSPSDWVGSAFEAAPIWDLPDDVRRELRETAMDRLKDAVREHGLEGETVVADGPAALALLRAAEDSGAELVAVGTKGRTGLRRLVLGSVAEEVARLAGCSVLVVRPQRGGAG